MFNSFLFTISTILCYFNLLINTYGFINNIVGTIRTIMTFLNNIYQVIMIKSIIMYLYQKEINLSLY